MKNFKKGFLALAIIASVSGAFVSNAHAAKKLVDDTFNWQELNTDGSVKGGGQFEAGVDQTQAEMDFSCPNTNTVPCAGTVDHQDGELTATPIILTKGN